MRADDYDYDLETRYYDRLELAHTDAVDSGELAEADDYQYQEDQDHE